MYVCVCVCVCLCLNGCLFVRICEYKCTNHRKRAMFNSCVGVYTYVCVCVLEYECIRMFNGVCVLVCARGYECV